jgi:hypothetical protein
MDQWFRATVFVVFLSSLCFNNINSVTVLHQFPRPNGPFKDCTVDKLDHLNHLTIGRNGRVYVAGVNRLMQLNSNLDVEECVVTGNG